MNATIAAQMKTIEILEAQAVEKDDRIAELKDAIAAKEEIIKAHEARIAELERQLAAVRMSDMDNYPFSIGVAEDNKRPNI
jgi:multidrug efflux pump subunit AcrA (membrane-fusion protein)